ncbi:ubiquinone anaerobic biosynthesis accessory factor UbiT [Vogesella oryzae]|uniref:ubiquinone anaerobic biosynthesis accessory factor UbiT n=1 Tax=Vogesella oryzae TaxID=1735285 RepID=UPI0015839FB8|nr:SCP2 sterol-binding domain-containing protein [Vogesella oryzae]
MPVPELKVPATLARVLGKLPATPPVWGMVRMLNLLAARGILPVDHGLLAGRQFCIRVLDAGISLHFASDGSRFVASHADTPPDLLLAADLADFARLMLREEDPDTLFFNRRLRIEGDTELGLTVKNLLDSVDWQHTPLARFMAV